MGVLNNRWFFGSTGDEPQPIANIGESLRFRGASSLTRTFGTTNTTWTSSLWVKRGDLSTDTTGPQQLLSFNNGVTQQRFQENDAFLLGDLAISTSVYRDPSAWYHVVCNCDGTTSRAWINGKEITDLFSPAPGTRSSGGDTSIGLFSTTELNGYLADIYHIDGQALEPTSFGLYDEEGVWVPREVDFNDPTTATPRWSDWLTATVGTIDSGQEGPAMAFNGDLSDGPGRVFTSAGGELTWAPEVDANFSTSFEIFNTNAASQQNITWNGNTVQPTGGWVTVFSGSGTINATTPLVISATSGGARGELYAVRLDGEILLDPFMWSGQLTTSTPGAGRAGFQNANSNANAFDGTTGDFAQSATSGVGETITFAPSTDIPFETLSVFVPTPNATISFNGGTAVASNSGQVQIATNGTLSSTATIVVTSTNSTTAPNLAQVLVNGRALVNGQNNSYGPNGFHLTFSDPNNLGADTSGNNNNFTPAGFNTDPVGIFSDDYTADQPFTQNNPATLAFDGNTGTLSSITNQGTGTFAPATPIQVNQRLEVVTYSQTDQIVWTWTNDSGTNTGGVGDAVQGPSSWQIGPNGATGTISTTNPLVLSTNPALGTGATVNLAAVIVDGVTLVDNTGEDYDPMQDSPSNNYPTINPLYPSTDPPEGENPTDANLAYLGKASRFGTQASTMALPSTGEFYAEWTMVNFTDDQYFGVCRMPINTSGTSTGHMGLYCFSGSNWQFKEDSNVTSSGTSGVGTGSVISIAYNAGTGLMRAWSDGVLLASGTFTTRADYDHLFFFGSLEAKTSNEFAANYGQKPFVHAASLGFTDANKVESQNLSAAPVTNGTDHFRTVTADGASILDVAQANLNGFFGDAGFSEGLWWIKASNTANTNQHQLLDSINGNSAVRLPGPTSPAAYTPPTGDSVAWCWSTTEAYTDASIDSGRRNPTAGFSHFNYTGDGNNTRNLAHGLGAPPDWVIIFDPNANDVKCFVRGLAGTGSSTNNLILSTSEAAGNVFSAGIIYNPDDNNTFTVGLSQSPTNVNSVNQLGVEYRAFCWRNIDGYSQFGSYQGTDDANVQPFIYTGFKPSFVMIKNSNSGPWMMFDTTRSPDNLATGLDQLQAQSTDGEIQENQNTIDFCANGFKIRGAGGNINGGADKMYMAFAANPLGGSNVNPATAALTGPPQIPGINAGIGKSLRFKSADNARLTRTPATNGSTTWTWSAWIKKGDEDARDELIFGTASPLQFHFIRSNVFTITQATVQDNDGFQRRDPAAWYHRVDVSDGTTIRMYINGVQTVSWNQASVGVNTNVEHFFGGEPARLSEYFEGYLADVYFVDGQALEPTTFAETNDNNVWVPIEDPTITDYGTNGFKLVMDPAYVNGTTLQDQSGNGNDWTMNDFDTDDYFSSDFDFMRDGPGQNFAVLNSVDPTGGTPVDANLETTSSAAGSAPTPSATILGLTEGDYYIEFGGNNGNAIFAITSGDTLLPLGSPLGGATAGLFFTQNNLFGGSGSTSQALTPSVTQTADFNWAIRVNIDNQEMSFWANGTSQGTFTFAQLETNIGGGLTLQNQPLNFFGCSATGTANYNFGQQPYRHTQPTGTTRLQSQALAAPTITDGRDHFRVLTGPGQGADGSVVAGETSGNFSQDVYGNNSSTYDPDTSDKIWLSADFGPDKMFDGVLGDGAEVCKSGTGSAETWIYWRPKTAITGVTSLAIWCSNTQTVRINGGDPTGDSNGSPQSAINIANPPSTLTSIAIQGNGISSATIGGIVINGNTLVDLNILAQAQDTFANGLYIIKDRDNTNQNQIVDTVRGVTLASTCPQSSKNIAYAAPTGDCVAWCWNSSAPATTGFNIIEYTGDANPTQAVAHGLPGTPELIITCSQSVGTTGTGGMETFHVGCTAGESLTIDSSRAEQVSARYNAVDGTNITWGGDYNDDGQDFIAYAWTSITGYSAFGAFDGNTSTDGPFVYTGFKPSLVMIKAINGGTNWLMLDTTRNPLGNPTNNRLFLNTQNPEQENEAASDCDFLSNGFKPRVSNGTINSTAGTPFAWAAWAENPFGGSNTVPVNAR